MDDTAYVDMWIAWTDSYHFSMGLGGEAGVNEQIAWDDTDADHNIIVSIGYGTWASETLRITFFPGKHYFYST